MLITTTKSQRCSVTAETGRTVSMRQALAYLAQKRPQAVVLRKRSAR